MEKRYEKKDKNENCNDHLINNDMNAYLDEIAGLRLDWEMQLGEKEADQNQMERK